MDSLSTPLFPSSVSNTYTDPARGTMPVRWEGHGEEALECEDDMLFEWEGDEYLVKRRMLVLRSRPRRQLQVSIQ